ncbi:MAG: CapA family protein, partial [Chloroflexota bacterium]|nr:CapA family protein [Chloroflexota bacterium]
MLLLLGVTLGGCTVGSPAATPPAGTATPAAEGTEQPAITTPAANPTGQSATVTPAATTAEQPASATLPAPAATTAPDTSSAPQTTPSPPPVGGASEITLAAVGDIMLARSIGAALRSDPTDTPFAGVAKQLREADVTVGNLECALGAIGRPAPKSYTFLGPAAGAPALADAGFDVLSLANNHSLDYGVGALRETLALLDGASVAHAGAGLDEGQAHRPARVTVKGLTLAFLAYVNVPVESSGYDIANWEAVGDEPGVAWARPARIAADVAAARGDADLVIVLLHSGEEEHETPNSVQRAAAYAAIDAGAALVLGHHPHVLQGVERYRGGLIAYSLGNFVFDGFETPGIIDPGIQSAILTLTLTRDGVQSYD